MRVLNLIAVTASAAFTLIFMVSSADRAEARHGWGLGGLAAGHYRRTDFEPPPPSQILLRSRIELRSLE